MIILSDGNRVRLARIGQGWTLQNVADRIGCSISYLSKVEHNTRPIPKDLVILMDSVRGTDWYDAIEMVFHMDEYVLNAVRNALKIKED